MGKMQKPSEAQLERVQSPPQGKRAGTPIWSETLSRKTRKLNGNLLSSSPSGVQPNNCPAPEMDSFWGWAKRTFLYILWGGDEGPPRIYRREAHGEGGIFPARPMPATEVWVSRDKRTPVSVGKLIPGMPEEIAEATLLPHPLMVCWAGSHAHGTVLPGDAQNNLDDIDILEVHLGKLPQYFGFKELRSHHRIVDSWDVTAHGIVKFVKLLLAGNPQAISSMFLPDPTYIFMTPSFKLLMEIKKTFLTKRLINSFGGYAKGELKRMVTIPMAEKYGPVSLGKRQQLFSKYGYNVSAASHALRLLQMGIEILGDGEVKPDRYAVGDAEIYMAIKNGEWKLTDVLRSAESLSEIFDRACRESILPLVPNEDLVSEVLTKILAQEFCSEVVSKAFSKKES